MSPFQNLPFSLRRSFESQSVLKVISGLANFDKDSVLTIARAASIGGADLIDMACRPDLVAASLEISSLPICVSSVVPELFPEAVAAGAVMIEIGNFDSFYSQDRFFDAAEVLDITRRTRKLLPEIFLSVTVPHLLPLDQQVNLALALKGEGVNLIQTEGGTSSSPNSPGTLGLIEKATPTLAAAHSISHGLMRAGCQLPVLCASGLSEVTAPMAIAAGASGVGVGSAINRLTSELEMIAMVQRLREAIDSLNFVYSK